MRPRCAATAAVSAPLSTVATVPTFFHNDTVPACRAKTPASKLSSSFEAHARRSSETVGSSLDGINEK
eukprot:5107127-Prymnesium_polylepis.1